MAFTRKRPQRRAVLVLLLAAAALFVAGCTDFDVRTAMPPDAATTQGQATRNLYDIVFAIGIAVFVLVEGLILFAVLRYRRRKGDDERRPRSATTTEIIWTASDRDRLGLFVLSCGPSARSRCAEPPVRVGVAPPMAVAVHYA
jgi:heme/copper-type cytochrome/quinol oxidase subunit 2